jgi:hypothetical protein
VIQEMLAKQRAILEEEMKKRGENVAALKPLPAPAPAPTPAPAAPAFDRSQMELSFWDSIKNSANPEDFKAYLAQYPQGTFAALARSRANPAKPAAPAVAATAQPPQQQASQPVQALKPIEPPKPVPPAAPLQVASIAPAAMIGMGIDDPRFPRIGDAWEYSYTDTYTKKKRKARYEITAVSKDGILEAGGFADAPPSTRAYSGGPHLVHHAMWDFSPYTLSFDSLKPGDSWTGIPPQGGVCIGVQMSFACKFDGKVVGREKVTTPAGSFDALKILIDMSMGSGWAWRQLTFWYAVEAKRVVKSSAKTIKAAPRPSPGMTDDYEFELTSYKLN